MARQQAHRPDSNGDPKPDVAIRDAVGMITTVRKGLDVIRGNTAQVAALRDVLYQADAELGYAAWQVGVLKGQLRRERRTMAELEARVHTLMEGRSGREQKDNDG